MREIYKYRKSRMEDNYWANTLKWVPHFIFFGRLSYEKWFDRVILFAQYLFDNPWVGVLEICWEGDLQDDLMVTCQKHNGFVDTRFMKWETHESYLNSESVVVIYHGRVSRDVVDSILKRSHYSLMPSRFLETFWLSALESIERGVPVIGSTKGGLSQFLLSHQGVDDFLRDEHTTRAYLLKFDTIARSFTYEYWKSESAAVLDVAQRYTKDIWMDEVREEFDLIGARKILLLSDFSAPIGGIETHVSSISSILREMGYECRVLHANSGKTPLIRVYRFSLLFEISFSLGSSRTVLLLILLI